MLHIQKDVRETRWVVLTLQGHIVGEWSGVLERECEVLLRSGVMVVLNLSGVVFIGRSGIAVLGRLARVGVGLVDCPPLIADVLEQEGIEVQRAFGDANNGTVDGKPGGSADP